MVRHALVVGGGIAGLSAAIALGRSDVRVTVVERENRATGAAIAFQYRPIYALQELGILDQVIERGSAITAAGSRATPVYDRDGQQRAVPTATVDDGWTVPVHVSIYRPQLSSIMQDAARQYGVELLIGHSCRSIEQHDEGVEAELTTGKRCRFDLVVAADGIYSGLRERFFAEVDGPTYTGSMSFRAMFTDAPEDWHSGLHVVDGGVVRTTMLPGRLFYLAVPSHMKRRHVGQDEAREIMRNALGSYQGSRLLTEVSKRLTEDIRVIVAPFEWTLVPPPWHRGRIVLVGDAAHATAPTIGSGGGMAVEDAVVLAQELAHTDDVETALTGYSDRRKDRAKLVVETSVAVMRGEQEHRPDEEWAAMRASAFQKLAEAY
jgi:2-polyprenyl-6-methoxyphenol hydroxylase-like FAD-dependent oxidoreductase